MSITIQARGRPFANLAAAALLVAAPTAAQGSAGSESQYALAHGTAGAAGRAQSESHQLVFTLAQEGAGEVLVSENAQLHAGVAWAEGGVGAGAPVVFGVHTSAGTAAGGDAVTVFGLNFDDPSAGATSASFGASLGANALVTGPSTIAVETPAGTDGVGNPLAGVPVSVSNAHGEHGARGAFAYLPALLQLTDARVGTQFELTLLASPGSIQLLWTGSGALPGQFLSIAPFGGALALMNQLVFVKNGELNATGTDKQVFAIPDEPALAGQRVDFQAFAVTDPFAPAGSFSNLLTVDLLP